jgi:hypothetical protein
MKTTRAILFGGILMAATVSVGDRVWAAPDEPNSSGTDVVKADADLSEIRDRAGSMPIDQRTDIDKRIRATVDRVNEDAASTGQTKVATRVASKLGLTRDRLLELKGELGFSWGELVVAQTLVANSTVKLELADLASLRAEGLSWGAIAYGLRFHLEDLEEAIKAGARVATGLSKPKDR